AHCCHTIALLLCCFAATLPQDCLSLPDRILEYSGWRNYHRQELDGAGGDWTTRAHCCHTIALLLCCFAATFPQDCLSLPDRILEYSGWRDYHRQELDGAGEDWTTR
ncbi:hypothetical protein J6590_103664, partial [Homalodisca vitripennis]